MTRIVGIAGSLRRGSYNAALLRAATEALPDGVQLEIATLAGIPLYDGDVEEQGLPEPVSRVKDLIAAADGLLLATPEYNHSVPGVLKNGIDWCTRPTRDIPRVFGGKAVAIMGATVGQGGTRLAQVAWLPVLHVLGTRPWFGRQLNVSGAAQLFDAEGRLVDEKTRTSLGQFMAGFAQFARSRA